MGSPLAPVLSNLFMGHHEKLCWKIFRTPRYYFTDVMLMIHFAHFIRRIKRYYFSTIIINSRHPNIRFTMEREIDHKIHFFFFMISNDTHFLVTTVYRKKTCTGLLSNYLVLHRIPTNSFARLLIDQQHLVTRTSRNLPITFRRIFYHSI